MYEQLQQSRFGLIHIYSSDVSFCHYLSSASQELVLQRLDSWGDCEMCMACTSPKKHLCIETTSFPNILFVYMSLPCGGRQLSHFQPKPSKGFLKKLLAWYNPRLLVFSQVRVSRNQLIRHIPCFFIIMKLS